MFYDKYELGMENYTFFMITYDSYIGIILSHVSTFYKRKPMYIIYLGLT